MLCNSTFRFLQALSGTQPELRLISQYYFNGEGKAIRPVITMCLARAVNHHLNQNSLYDLHFFLEMRIGIIINIFFIDREVIAKQKKVAQIAEMIHTASLVTMATFYSYFSIKLNFNIFNVRFMMTS